MTRTSGTKSGAGWAAVIVASICLGAAQAESSKEGEIIEAVWKPQQVNFVYRGYGTRYSCEALERKLRKVLFSLGAASGLTLQGYGCNNEVGTAQFQIALESPVVATPDTITEITTHDAKEQLVARTRGERLATAEDVKRFPAVWKTVSFASDRTMKLDPEDCELVRQLRKQILAKMSVQVVRDNLRCSPGYGNIGPPRLTVSALVPLHVGVGR